MMRLRRIFTISLLGISVSMGYTQGQFQVSADLRSRAEYRHGFSAPSTINQTHAFFIDQRSRLIFDFQSEKYVIKMSFQDVRVWGNQSQLVRTDGALTALHEGWAQVFFTPKFSIKAGRQEIILDDHRIMGNVDWAMQGRSHDAALLKYSNKGWDLLGALAYNQDNAQLITRQYTIANNYKALQFIWLHKEATHYQGSLLFLRNGKQGSTPNETEYSNTLGGRIGYKSDKLKSNLAGYNQSGLEANGTTHIKAYYVGWDLNYKVNNNFNVTPGIEVMSGNSQISMPASNKAFNPFYGTNHKFNGLMDYYYVGNHINSVGLQDYFLQLNFPVKKFLSSIQFHYFNANAGVLNPIDQTRMKPLLGTELDIVLQYKLSDQVQFDGGYSRYFSSSTLEVLKGGNQNALNAWAWIMLSVKPVLYKTPAPENKPNP